MTDPVRGEGLQTYLFTETEPSNQRPATKYIRENLCAASRVADQIESPVRPTPTIPVHLKFCTYYIHHIVQTTTGVAVNNKVIFKTFSSNQKQITTDQTRFRGVVGYHVSLTASELRTEGPEFKPRRNHFFFASALLSLLLAASLFNQQNFLFLFLLC
ncbi:hypothetical protein K504DRAFT_212389 [Pleomassaria siparia CBS 279.74]|uniref:Uncharacterized protein n=1 Tax=Pleomassaria siparia CBS 279.74 TaxID=1314801 RepID=A0A6G1KJK2_9PLEO|nr:hypothetical protein K504DRAFT_212389 [Pleomassaria siparia CBS 279.74]